MYNSGCVVVLHRVFDLLKLTGMDSKQITLTVMLANNAPVIFDHDSKKLKWDSDYEIIDQPIADNVEKFRYDWSIKSVEERDKLWQLRMKEWQNGQ